MEVLASWKDGRGSHIQYSKAFVVSAVRMIKLKRSKQVYIMFHVHARVCTLFMYLCEHMLYNVHISVHTRMSL